MFHLLGVFSFCNFGHHQYRHYLRRIDLIFLLLNPLSSDVALLINVINLSVREFCLHASHLHSFSLWWCFRLWCDVLLPFYDGSLLLKSLFLFLLYVPFLLVLLTKRDLLTRLMYLVIRLCHGFSCWELELWCNFECLYLLNI